MNEVDLTDDASASLRSSRILPESGHGARALGRTLEPRGSGASSRRQRCRNVDVPVEADGLDRVAVNETTIQRESPCLATPAVH